MIHDTQSVQNSQKQDERKYICNHEYDVSSQLSPQLLCGDSCTWAHDVRLHIACTNKPKNDQQAKQGA